MPGLQIRRYIGHSGFNQLVDRLSVLADIVEPGVGFIQLVFGFREIIGDHQSGHQHQPVIADLAELALERIDLLANRFGEFEL